ncbi:MAG: DUF1294 domain-containing protein [Clostridia bacterium]|nr:DUF1294 domain-containing protein [Clostridia bacterium]
MKTLLIVYACIVGAASLIAFFAYGADKLLAKGDGGRRISERTLLALAVYGGALGAFLGRMAFRHKTRKDYFTLVITFALLLQAGVLVLLIKKGAGEL